MCVTVEDDGGSKETNSFYHSQSITEGVQGLETSVKTSKLDPGPVKALSACFTLYVQCKFFISS